MKTNTLTPAKAVQIYLGASFGTCILIYTGVLLGMFVPCILFFAASAESVFKDPYVDLYLYVDLYIGLTVSAMVAALMQHTFEKTMPGGKFYRSLPEGFTAYRKMRLGMRYLCILVSCLYLGIICAANMVIPFMNHGTAKCVSVLVWLVHALGLADLIQMIPHGTARAVLSSLVMLFSGFGGVMMVYTGMWYVTVLLAVNALWLLPFSYRAMLNSYRSTRWDV